MSLRCIIANCDSRGYAYKCIRLIRQVGLRQAATGGNIAPLEVIHVSSFAQSIAAPLLPAEMRHHVVSNPVEINKASPVAVRDNGNFVFIGRLTPEKQGVAFAKAAARAGVPATFLGEGPQTSAIRAANPRAVILPWGNAETVERVLASARAIVFPSSWYETGGLVVAEALARGVPAVVSTGTGAQELIEDGENGLLCPPGDLTGLVGRLQVLNQPEVAERMGQNAFSMYWKAPLSVPAHVDRLLSVYDLVLDRHGLHLCQGWPS